MRRTPATVQGTVAMPMLTAPEMVQSSGSTAALTPLDHLLGHRYREYRHGQDQDLQAHQAGALRDQGDGGGDHDVQQRGQSLSGPGRQDFWSLTIRFRLTEIATNSRPVRAAAAAMIEVIAGLGSGWVVAAHRQHFQSEELADHER